MSYTNGITPIDLSFMFMVEYWAILVSFTCPRCKKHVRKLIKLEDITNFEIECTNLFCRLPDERAGYTLTCTMKIDGALLGETDRPLHTNPQVQAWWDRCKKR